MKRLVGIFFLGLVATVAQAQVQVEEEDWKTPLYEQEGAVYGRAGVSMVGVSGRAPLNQKPGRNTGWNISLGYTHLLSYAGDVRVNAEIGLSRQGFRYENVQSPGQVEQVYLNYINIPLFVKYHPIKSFRWAYVGAGPQIGFRTGGYVKTKGGTKYAVVNSEFVTTDLAAIGVAGINFGKRIDFGMEMRYQHSFSKFMQPAPNLKHSVFQATLIFPGEILLQALQFITFFY